MPFIRLITIYIIVIAAVFILFNRDKVMELTGLSPDMFQTEESARENTDADEATTETVTEETTAKTAAPVQEAETEITKTPASATTEETAEQQTPKTEPASEPAPVETATTDVAATPEPKEPETQAPETTVAVQPAPTPAAQAPAPKAENRPAKDDKAAVTAGLNKARGAYKRGNFQQSEAAYVALGDKFPDSADVQGEIGNFYYSQRQYPNAATYYYKTGKALLKIGDTQKLGQIINILQRLAPNLAADLRARVDN